MTASSTSPLPVAVPAAGSPAVKRQEARLGGLDRFLEAEDRLPLALEDLDLAVHEGRPAGEGRDLVGEVHGFLDGRAVGELRELVGRGGASRLVPGRLGAGLGHEELDLGDLALQLRGIGGKLRGEFRRGGHECCITFGSSSGDDGTAQSSGILIQPWRIA